MKRFMILVLAMMLCATTFAGCRRNQKKDEPMASSASTTPVTTTPTVTTHKDTTPITTTVSDDGMGDDHSGNEDGGTNGGTEGDNSAVPGETNGDTLPGRSRRSRFRRIG